MRRSIALRLQWSLSRARSSAGERSPHTREVAGSNPAAPIRKALLMPRFSLGGHALPSRVSAVVSFVVPVRRLVARFGSGITSLRLSDSSRVERSARYGRQGAGQRDLPRAGSEGSSVRRRAGQPRPHLPLRGGLLRDSGPNLDELKPSRARVLTAIDRGGTGSGRMPPKLLPPADAKRVAAFVANAVGGGR